MALEAHDFLLAGPTSVAVELLDVMGEERCGKARHCVLKRPAQTGMPAFGSWAAGWTARRK